VVQERFPGLPVPPACFSTTVELRGEADTDHGLAHDDAAAIVEFLRRQGLIAGMPKPLPEPRCAATPLAASEPLVAPCAGVVVFHAQPGEAIAAGQQVADVTNPDTGEVHPVQARSSGVLYARVATRWAGAGKRLGKIAGTTLVRTGKLLSP
jgi:predicted deacylase